MRPRLSRHRYLDVNALRAKTARGSLVKRGPGKPDQFAVRGVAERVASYEYAHLDESRDELVAKAATLLLVMPPHQSRKTIEELVSPHDPELGERAVTALIDSAFAAEDDHGRLRRLD
jgi:hypothetical protein